MISYQVENDLSCDEFISVLQRSTLGERRPVNDPERITAMLAHGNLILTARDNGNIIGVARSLTDFSFCTYLSDLAVDKDYQRKGIGKELIRRTQLAAPKAKLILLAAPAAVHYYPHIGMKRHEYCFYIDHADELK
ncbi:GNAT family N-acetyltransferase [Agriterribacter sp.]|uniref:GNAT family N-acetyltransferase n=1 Tax=Agriterribacter sp. TaxID=2821509 RepID=UPI002B92A873|nr:GNAT family N-acetyltransferase [Agriterribacter sp.]HRO46406.1 GNAT family N-acetyltransferase [Agriterribacter sp.]HRQ17594.1 GNAT family N-acetyltransferase [Agriterribacter sp.]